MFVVCDGHRRWSLQRSREGEKEYRLVHRVEWQEGTGTGEHGYGGPNAALHAEGLPQPGDAWVFPGVDEDTFAYCRLDATATPVPDDGSPTTAFDVEQIFSTRADPGRCKVQEQTDPLSQPPSVSVSFTRFTEQATHDRFGQPLAYSSHEPIREHFAEFDQGRLLIKIEFNVASLNPFLLASMIDTVNEAELWGFPRRYLKLSNAGAQELYYGDCLRYVRLSCEFEAATGGRTHDRDVRDVGHRCLKGHWHPKADLWVLDRVPGCGGESGLPNRFNPAHFQAAHDRAGNPMLTVLLDGRPYQPDSFAYTFQGSPAAAKDEADSVHAAYLGPYASEAAARAACCIAGTGTGTGALLPGLASRNLYVAVAAVASGNNDAVPENPDYWVVLRGSPHGSTWSASVTYQPGDVVTITAGGTTYYWVATAGSYNVVPNEPGQHSWAALPAGLTARGDWIPGHAYAVGDYVIQAVPAGTPSGDVGTGAAQWWCIAGVGDPAPGVIHVEFYRESDFTKLGIPTTL